MYSWIILIEFKIQGHMSNKNSILIFKSKKLTLSPDKTKISPEKNPNNIHFKPISIYPNPLIIPSNRIQVTKDAQLSPSLKPRRKDNLHQNTHNTSLIDKSFRLDLSQFGNNNQQTLHFNETVRRQQFSYFYVIGKGGFGKVWMVQHKKTKKMYAMKEMLKVKIINKKSINSIMNQRLLLAQLKHPFIINMNYAFQDREHLYLVMDLLTGGDLRYHITKRKTFKQNESKFFIACIIVGLEYLHENNIIHRDIKPQNLVVDQKGYLRITDLGIARKIREGNGTDTSGTPGYMAPEVMCRQDHGFSADYYAVGVIAYQLMLSKRPYFGKTRKEIRDQILAKQVQVKQEELPEGWSLCALDFVNRMIQRRIANRLGNSSIHQIKLHPWFKGFPWNKFVKRQIAPPFSPKNVVMQQGYRQQISETTENQIDAQNRLMLRRKSVQDLFQGYTMQSKDEKKTATTLSFQSRQPVKKNNFLFET